MKQGMFFSIFLGVVFLTGCQTVKPQDRQSREQSRAALQAVAGAITGQEVSAQQMKDLGEDLQKDPEARSAVQAITGSLEGDPAAITYCPVDGKRYAPNVKRCPVHDVELKTLEN